jgi:hypothetical protein
MSLSFAPTIHTNRYRIPVKIADQIKNRRFNIVAPNPNYYQMDIAFFGKYKYLVIIGTNNRYVWAIAINTKDQLSIFKALILFSSFDTFRHIYPVMMDCDGEASFKDTPELPNFRIHSLPDPHHNRLALVNRVIRTIRDYAYKMFDAEDDIDPAALEQVVHYYNNYPHKTLSNLIGFNVSPHMLLLDLDLEAFIAKKLMSQNLKESKKKLAVGDKVMVGHVTKKFEKVRFNTEPVMYTIIGYKNNMYIVENKYSKKLIVPGYLLGRVSLRKS